MEGEGFCLSAVRKAEWEWLSVKAKLAICPFLSLWSSGFCAQWSSPVASLSLLLFLSQSASLHHRFSASLIPSFYISPSSVLLDFLLFSSGFCSLLGLAALPLLLHFVVFPYQKPQLFKMLFSVDKSSTLKGARLTNNELSENSCDWGFWASSRL